MKGSKLVVFFGSDGSGKTTQARSLASHLQRQGFRVIVVWIRAHHSFASVLSKILVRLGYFRYVVSYGKTRRSFVIELLPGLRGFFGLLEFISVLPWILTRVKLPLLLGYVVIAERYVVDTIVNIAYFLHDPRFLRGYAARILLAMVPKDAFLIFLDAETETIISRIEKRREELDVDFIEFQRKSYASFAALLGALSINNSNIDETSTFQIMLDRYEKRK